MEHCRDQLLAATGTRLDEFSVTRNSIDYLDIVRLTTESLADVEAQLEGCVFHVTRRAYWPSILAAGAILPNSDRDLPTTFGFSANSSFRKRGCVSLFDWRKQPPEDYSDARYRCWPFQPPAIREEGLAMAVMSPDIEDRLLAWNDGRNEDNSAEMVVPYVEAGHLGPIDLALVERVIFVRRKRDPNSEALEDLLDRSWDDSDH